MNDRASHRAAVEAGYADLASYVAKYGDEPEYPGASIRTVRMVWPGTGELGEVRLMDYGSGSKKRYRVAAFCPGRVVDLPGDTPKVEPEADNWCVTLADASAWFGLYVARERADGWKHADDPAVTHSKLKPSAAPRWNNCPPASPRYLYDAEVLARARAIVSLPPPYYGYSDVGNTLVSYLRGEQNAPETMQFLDGLAIDFERTRKA